MISSRVGEVSFRPLAASCLLSPACRQASLSGFPVAVFAGASAVVGRASVRVAGAAVVVFARLSAFSNHQHCSAEPSAAPAEASGRLAGVAAAGFGRLSVVSSHQHCFAEPSAAGPVEEASGRPAGAAEAGFGRLSAVSSRQDCSAESSAVP